MMHIIVLGSVVVRDKVLVSTKNLVLLDGNKMGARFIGIFPVKKRVRKVGYHLTLSG